MLRVVSRVSSTFVEIVAVLPLRVELVRFALQLAPRIGLELPGTSYANVDQLNTQIVGLCRSTIAAIPGTADMRGAAMTAVTDRPATSAAAAAMARMTGGSTSGA